jgi:hypothetical protein
MRPLLSPRPRPVLPLALFALLSLTACGSGDDAPAPVAPTPTPPAQTSWTVPTGAPPLVANVATDSRSQTDIAPGVTLYKFEVGYISSTDGFEVNAGFVRTQEDAAPLIAALRAAGHQTKLLAAADAGQTGYAIRVDKRYPTAGEADAAVTAIWALSTLPASTEKLAVGIGRVYTAEDGGATSGPYRISLLAIRPQFKGTLRSALATDIAPGRETTTALSKRLGALAAINGGFFQFGRANGTDGSLAGLSIIDGRLVNEGVEGRPALLIGKNPDGSNGARVERKLSTVITVTKAGGAARRIDGMNRRPQVSVNCGRPFDVETRAPLHDALCTNDNAIVDYTPDFGPTASTEIDGAAAVTEVAIGANGIVAAVTNQAGSAIPAGGHVLQGIGTGAAWLRANLKIGDVVGVKARLVNDAGTEIVVKPGLYAVNGGPTLLLNGGNVDHEHAAEGWGNANDPGYAWSKPNGNRANFYNGWYLRRNPRTAIGIAKDGTLLLMVSDGRAPKYSAGLSIRETALVMKHFGAVDAINLDGGGSSMMVARDIQQTLPSDAGNVERADGDALLVFEK